MSAYTLDYTYTAPSALIDGAASCALSPPHSALRDSHPLPAVISTPTAGSRRSSRALMLLALGVTAGVVSDIKDRWLIRS